MRVRNRRIEATKQNSSTPDTIRCCLPARSGTASSDMAQSANRSVSPMVARAVITCVWGSLERTAPPTANPVTGGGDGALASTCAEGSREGQLQSRRRAGATTARQLTWRLLTQGRLASAAYACKSRTGHPGGASRAPLPPAPRCPCHTVPSAAFQHTLHVCICFDLHLCFTSITVLSKVMCTCL